MLFAAENVMSSEQVEMAIPTKSWASYKAASSGRRPCAFTFPKTVTVTWERVNGKSQNGSRIGGVIFIESRAFACGVATSHYQRNPGTCDALMPDEYV
jgi:hypothetical protein